MVDNANGWAIVAIPEEQDPVWKYSSEKIPHMTLLFLGDQTGVLDQDHMAAYVQHIAETSLRPFYMTVERRGTLGPQDADVLFFDMRKGQSSPLPGQARGYLLADDDVQKAFNSVEQFPEWTPHLTMGYPTSPAKKDDRDYSQFYSVRFDKIALWTGNYIGPEFQLQEPTTEEQYPALAMSELISAGEEFLQHKKFTTEDRTKMAKTNEAMPDGSFPIKTSKDLKNAIGLAGNSKTPQSARKHIIARAKALGLDKQIPDTWNSDGTIKHSDVEDFVLEHHGVKGMHWGVRHTPVTSTTISSKGGKIKKVQLSDRVHTQRSKPSTDAQRAAVAKAVVRKHSTDSLSNDELKALVTRMNLEQQYSNLANNQRGAMSSGHKAVKEALGYAKTGQEVYNVANSPMMKDLRKQMNG